MKRFFEVFEDTINNTHDLSYHRGIGYLQAVIDESFFVNDDGITPLYEWTKDFVTLIMTKTIGDFPEDK